MGIKVSHPSYANSSHRKRARDYLSLIEPAFRDVSKAQLNYIALITTDERVATDTKQMLVCLALLAGPDLKKEVSEEDLRNSLNEAVCGAQRLLLEILPPEGRA